MKRLTPLGIFAVLLVSGCSTLSAMDGAPGIDTQGCGPSTGLILIVGSHRDTPRPSLDQQLECRVTKAIQSGKPVRIIVVSGQPEEINPPLVPTSGGTLAQQGSPRVREDIQRIRSAIAAARVASPGVDDLAALALAADVARTVGTPHAELVLLDSGLDDRGALDFAVPGMLAARPNQIAPRLNITGNMPDLHGFTVLLAGIGYTAAPQASMSAKWRLHLTRIWARLVVSAGASVAIDPHPAQGPSIRSGPHVKLIAIPVDEPIRPTLRSPIVFNGISPVRFRPNTTVLVDPIAAARALTPVARWLAAKPSRQARLVGTTADVGSLASQIELSRLRAARIGDELVTLGASPRQIKARGLGSHFAQFITDRAAGVLLERLAELNRSVRIALSAG